MWTLVSRAGARLTSIAGLLVLLAGIPAGQVLLVGWPLPHRTPTAGQVGDALTSRDWLTDTNLVNALSVLLWALWAMFVASVVVELVAAARGVTAPRYRLLAPTQGLAAMLVAGISTALLSASPSPAATTPLFAPAAFTPVAAPGGGGVYAVAAYDRGPAPVQVLAAADGTDPAPCAPTAPGADLSAVYGVGPVYEVVHGDWLWHISARYLGDPLRYVEIEKLNPNLELRDHRFPDHIEATWRIQLPADAHDRGARAHANGTLITTAPDPAPQPAPPGPADPGGPTPGPSTDPTASPTASTTPTRASTPGPGPAAPTAVPTAVTAPATMAPDPAGTTAQNRDGGAQPTPAPTMPGPTPSSPTVAPTAVTTPATALPGPVGTANPGQDPDGVVEPAPNPVPSGASPSLAPTQTGATPTTTATSTVPPPGTQAADPATTAPAAGQHGVSLPNRSGWVPWTLAGALVAAAAMVWLQRRRNYKPRPMDGTDADDRPEPEDLPPTMQAVQRAWRQRPDPQPDETLQPQPGPRAARPASATTPPPVTVPPVPAIPPLPPGGLGLTGPGAADAARGALVAALATGAPTDPDAQSTVVIPADDMITLLGADAVAIGTWPRLRVTPDLDTALKILEARLLGAARLLDEHDATDLAALRAPDSTAPPLPPMLLVTSTPTPLQQERTRMVLGLGQRLDVTAVLLGDWQHGGTVTVDPDGTCHPGGGAIAPSRLAVLDTAAARDLLSTLREAHTGEPAQPAPAEHTRGPAHNAEKTPSAAETTATQASSVDDGRAHVPAQTASNAEPRTSTQDTSPAEAPDGSLRARVMVLGPPQIANRPQTVRLRAYAVELLVYLAVHADGATSDEIMEDLWPDTRRGNASQRLHQATSNLRQNLAGSLPDSSDGADRPDPLLKVNGRWRLNPDAVNVDLWQLRAAHTAARGRSGQERLDALAQVCATYAGTLAGDTDYEWIGRHRQGVLNLAVDAHTALAAAIAESDPAEALRLLQTAAEIDPLNEDVARSLMRAQHRVGDLDAIRATVRRLKLTLDEIGAEPSPETTDLADELRLDLNRRTREPR